MRSRGSSPTATAINEGGIAQLAEHATVNRKVLGSNPSASANKEGIRLDEGLLLKSSSTERYCGFESYVFRN